MWFWRRGQPALAPRRLALVMVFQFLEHLNDRQATDAVRSRIDWKYAQSLELEDPGFHFSVLTEFRGRLNRLITIVRTCYTDTPPVDVMQVGLPSIMARLYMSAPPI
ncbi:MAG: transposase [Burkholderia sp.]|nr:transposase [Burkholderia sp.]